MGTVLLLVDNSNIFIGGKNEFGENARVSYDKFERLSVGNDELVEKYLAGSTPPANDAFWSRMKRTGWKVHTYERVSAGYGHTKEKAVDMVLGVLGAAAIQRIKPDRVVLMTGDRDFIPIAKLRDSMKEEQKYSFSLEVWAFSKALSSELERVCDHIFRIDNYKEELVFFQNEDGTTETFNEYMDRLARENAIREEKRQAERAAQDAEREAVANASKKKWEWVVGLVGSAATVVCIICGVVKKFGK